MNEVIKDFATILNEEESILDALTAQHVLLKKAVSEKNWESLNEVISKMNSFSSDFQQLDLQREEMQNGMKKRDI